MEDFSTSVPPQQPRGPGSGAKARPPPPSPLQVFLDQPGWTVMEDLSTFNYDSYAALVPELKRAVLRVKSELFITLDAVRAIEAAGGVDDTEMVGV